MPISPVRKATNLSLDPVLLAEARALGLNVSRAAEAGLAAAVRAARTETWRRENAAALASSNVFAETHGLPLEPQRSF